MVGWLDGNTGSMDMNLSKLQEIVNEREKLVCCSPWGHRVRHNLATEQQQGNIHKFQGSECGDFLKGPLFHLTKVAYVVGMRLFIHSIILEQWNKH